jgi:hypothetical protein
MWRQEMLPSNLHGCHFDTISSFSKKFCPGYFLSNLVVMWVLQGLQLNGLVCQDEISPEILLVYRTHLVMVAHKILAADTWCKDAKKLPKVETQVQIRATAHARDGSAPSSGAVFPGAFERSAWAQTLIRL